MTNCNNNWTTAGKSPLFEKNYFHLRLALMMIHNKSNLCGDDKIVHDWREPIRIDYLFDDIFLFCIFRTCFSRPRGGHSVSRAKGEAAYGCKVIFFIFLCFHVEYISFTTSTYDDGSFSSLFFRTILSILLL